MDFSAFPKIFAIGSAQAARLFNGKVEITEKVDGSQICFGSINGELKMRSKGAPLYADNPEKMFSLGIKVIVDLFEKNLLCDNAVYYGEYLRSPKHNVLSYEKIPNNHIALYGMLFERNDWASHDILMDEAERLGLDCVPLLYEGEVKTVEDLKSNLERISFLGNAKIEGFVIKNYAESLLIGGQVIPLLMGKYVSDDFKEVHKFQWKSENTSKGKWDVYKSQFCNTARWCKAIQHLRDKGEIEDSPKDIGKLLKEINVDIEAEEKENIKEWLWDEFGREIFKEAAKGFPQWYKERLLEKAFEEIK